jgi:hypothetical protein
MTDFKAVESCLESYKFYEGCAYKAHSLASENPAVFRVFAEMAESYLSRARELTR